MPHSSSTWNGADGDRNYSQVQCWRFRAMDYLSRDCSRQKGNHSEWHWSKSRIVSMRRKYAITARARSSMLVSLKRGGAIQAADKDSVSTISPTCPRSHTTLPCSRRRSCTCTSTRPHDISSGSAQSTNPICKHTKRSQGRRFTCTGQGAVQQTTGLTTTATNE